MTKKLKAVLITAACIIFIAAGYIGADCIRLRNSPCGTKPIITTGSEVSDRMIRYDGVGYTVGYYTSGGDYYGAEFRVLGKFLAWAWIT